MRGPFAAVIEFDTHLQDGYSKVTLAGKIGEYQVEYFNNLFQYFVDQSILLIA